MYIYIDIDFIRVGEHILRSISSAKIENGIIRIAGVEVSYFLNFEHILSYYRFCLLKKIIENYKIEKRVSTNIFKLIKNFNDSNCYISLKIASNNQVIYNSLPLTYENWDRIEKLSNLLLDHEILYEAELQSI